MNNTVNDYGLWGLGILNSIIFVGFAYSFFKPASLRDWPSRIARTSRRCSRRDGLTSPRQTRRVALQIPSSPSNACDSARNSN